MIEADTLKEYLIEYYRRRATGQATDLDFCWRLPDGQGGIYTADGRFIKLFDKE